jgi:putative nucleotidyltransferase with HDIG domain
MQTPDGGMATAPPPIQVRDGLCQLPVFRPVALKMLNLLANEEAEVRGISDLLRTDPSLSAEVLAAANSAFYGAPQHIDNLAQALLVLGFERARSLTLTVALRTFTRHPSHAKVMQTCWRHSLAVALLAEELASLYEVAGDRAYTAALIHDVGRLGLLRAYGNLYEPVFASRHDTVADCLESERALFGMDHCQAGLLLTQRWGFPSEYSRVAGCHHGEMPAAKGDLVTLTHTACLLASALGFPAMTIADAPLPATVVAGLPANPWKPYSFHEEQLKDRISKQIASVELN